MSASPKSRHCCKELDISSLSGRGSQDRPAGGQGIEQLTECVNGQGTALGIGDSILLRISVEQGQHAESHLSKRWGTYLPTHWSKAAWGIFILPQLWVVQLVGRVCSWGHRGQALGRECGELVVNGFSVHRHVLTEVDRVTPVLPQGRRKVTNLLPNRFGINVWNCPSTLEVPQSDSIL